MAEKILKYIVAPYSMSYKPLRLIASQIPEKIKGGTRWSSKKIIYVCIFFRISAISPWQTVRNSEKCPRSDTSISITSDTYHWDTGSTPC